MEEKKDIFDFIEKRPVETPDSSYFKNLADKVVAEAQVSQEKPQAKVIPLYRRSIVWISGVAAAVLVAFLLLPDSSNPEDPKNNIWAEIQPSKAEVLAYVNENIDDFDEELLIEYIAMKNLGANQGVTEIIEEEPLETMVKTETKSLQESLKQISDQEILDYLEMEGELNDDDDEFILL